MAKCTLPFWNDGQPFEPAIYPEDTANYDEAEAAATEPLAAERAKAEAAEAAVADLEAAKASRVKVAEARAESVKAMRAYRAVERKVATEVANLQRDLVVKVLTQTKPKAALSVKLTVAQIRGAFLELVTTGQDWRTDPDRPLGRSGASSAPSSSPVSTSLTHA